MGKEEKMKTPIEKGNFNWVVARQNCSAAEEFEALKKIVEENVMDRKPYLGGNAGAKLTFENESHSQCKVSFGDKGVLFHLKKDHIDVRYDPETDDDINFTATPFITGDWECRFKVDGEGEFLPWQVAHKALKNILF